MYTHSTTGDENEMDTQIHTHTDTHTNPQDELLSELVAYMPLHPSPELHYFPEEHPTYSCKECLVPLALQDELVSKAFSGRNGRAYLLHSTVNTRLGKTEERRLLTGLHTVADLLCLSCGSSLGWMYLKANDKDQEYKEGKYILEAVKVIKENNWDVDRV